MGNKVIEVNLEFNRPTVEQAIAKLKNELMTAKNQGVRAVILIHGYGSSGEGGKIKPAVAKCLAEDSMKGIVRDFAHGEFWVNDKKKFTNMCGSLSEFERRFSGNYGATVVILR